MNANTNLTVVGIDIAKMLRHIDYVTSPTANLSRPTKRLCHRG